jgi:alkaline phosphatase D
MITRRFFLAGTTAAAWATSARGAGGAPVFTLGVASGSPRPDGVVLWTRLAPKPLDGGGMAAGTTSVRWRLAADASMQRVVREGLAETSDADAHAVHVVLRGLEPGREYWYQFHFDGQDSPVGRTKTADPSALAAKLALASCSHYETGHFAAYADIARMAPDCVIHVGDYIYEGAGGSPRPGQVRQHTGQEIATLWDYRNRYALYRLDPSLQAAHAASPWIVAFDDHELDNNWAGETPQDPEKQTALEFKVRKIAAFKAYYEHMPIERPPVVSGLDTQLRLHDVYRFGPAQVHLLDTRQYRSDQPCGDNIPTVAGCREHLDPALTMTGAAQERWLFDQLARSTATYNVVASQTWLAPYRYSADRSIPAVNMDQWDGYPVQRQRVIDALAASQGRPVVLSGDWHCAAAMRIHRDPENPRSPRVGHNFAGTSVSSLCSWWDVVDRGLEVDGRAVLEAEPRDVVGVHEHDVRVPSTPRKRSRSSRTPSC